MDKYCKCKKIFWSQLCEEVKCFEEKPSSKTLKDINDLLKALNNLQYLKEHETEESHSEWGHSDEDKRTHHDMTVHIGAEHAMPKKLTEEQYKEWMRGLENADGSTGAHWTIEQTHQVQMQKGLAKYDKHAFWAAMNASYSDLCTLFRKHDMDTADAYAEYAVDFWFEDEDAVGGGNGDAEKLAAYYTAVVDK